MNFQLRSLAAAFRPKSRLSDADEAAPKPRLKTKAWSDAWQTCRRKAAHLNLRPRQSSTSTSSSATRISRDTTPPSLSYSDVSTSKSVLQVQYEPRPTPENVLASTAPVSATSDGETPLARTVSPSQVVYRIPVVGAETDGGLGKTTERLSEREGPKPRGDGLAHSPTVVSVTSDYDASVVDDVSCYGSFSRDRRLVVESYLQMQAETEQSFVDRY